MATTMTRSGNEHAFGPSKHSSLHLVIHWWCCLVFLSTLLVKISVNCMFLWRKTYWTEVNLNPRPFQALRMLRPGHMMIRAFDSWKKPEVLDWIGGAVRGCIRMRVFCCKRKFWTKNESQVFVGFCGHDVNWSHENFGPCIEGWTCMTAWNPLVFEDMGLRTWGFNDIFSKKPGLFDPKNDIISHIRSLKIDQIHGLKFWAVAVAATDGFF